MKDSQRPQRSDDKPAPGKGTGGAPIGTHSLTGDSANVGIPSPLEEHAKPERSTPRDTPPGAQEPDPLAEPRANTGEILGRKP